MGKKVFLSFIITPLFFCALFALQRKEQVSKPLEHEVTVTLVVVEAFITDKDGNFVDDLTINDFEIYEDGKKVRIQYFALAKPEIEVPKKVTPEKIIERKIPPPPLKMKLVIIFDNINTHKFYLMSQLPQIVEMLNAFSDKVEEAMIIELNRRNGMRIIQPFTSNRNLLASKISEFKVDYSKKIEDDFLRSQIEELTKEAQLSLENRILADPMASMSLFKEEAEYFNRQTLGDFFSSFVAAINYIRRFEGIKSVLLISDGLRLGGGFVRIFDPFKIFGGKKNFSQREAFGKFLELINEEKIIFYTVSPKGMRSYFSWAQIWPGDMFKDELRQWSNELYTLEEIATKTGGVYLKGAKKYEDLIKVLSRDLTHFYDISYSPPKDGRKPGFHRIEVRVKRAGLTVRHREGYSDFTKEELGRRAMASAFISPSLFKDIIFACKADILTLREEVPQFWVRMQIPLSQFVNLMDARPPEKLDLMFGINEWEKQKVHFGETELQLKGLYEKGFDTLYHAFVASGVKLEPGEYEARVILRQEGDQIGGWETSLRVTDFKKQAPLSIINSILGLLKKEEDEVGISFSLSKKKCSLILSGCQFFPLVENIFDRKAEAALFLQVYNPDKIPGPYLQFFLKNEDGSTTLALPFYKVESFFDQKNKISNEVYQLKFDQVPPGDYLLKIISAEALLESELRIKIIS